MKGFVLAMLAIALPVSAAARETELPGWMAGCWEMREGERWAEECWTIPRAGMMMGSGRTGTGDGISSWEFMHIERADEGLIFSASPRGAGWTAFASAADPAGGVTFLNSANDYPQRVRYWREGETLIAEISLENGERAVRWTFTRMGG